MRASGLNVDGIYMKVVNKQLNDIYSIKSYVAMSINFSLKIVSNALVNLSKYS